MTCFDQLREFRADESHRAGFDHEWLPVLTFLCSFWVYVLDEGSYFPFCSCNSWMLNLYLQLFLALLWPFSNFLIQFGFFLCTRAVLRGLFPRSWNGANSLVFNTKKISLHAQVQFHAKYPLFDSQSDREFTFSYAILHNVPHTNDLRTKMKIRINNTNSNVLKNNAYDTSKWIKIITFVTLRNRLLICMCTRENDNNKLELEYNRAIY